MTAPVIPSVLPADYDELTEDGQRSARLAVVSDYSTPTKAVIGWYYFRQWYLVPYAGFFKDYCPSATFHFDMIYDLYAYEQNIEAAPRGSAKSYVIGTEVPLRNLCTRPHYDTSLLLATKEMVEERFDVIMQQLEDNPYLIADFGAQKPGRGSGTWSKKYLRLRNGARLKGFGIGGRKRGARPDLLIMDDPEVDKNGQQINQKLREAFEVMLFQVLLPMLREGCKLYWVGTLINRRTFIYSAFHGDDKRFDRWNRRLMVACRLQDGGMTDLIWPEFMSLSYLQNKLLDMGPSFFGAEYLNAPGSAQGRMLQLDPIKNRYEVNGFIDANPFATDPATVIVYHIKGKSDREAREATADDKGDTGVGPPIYTRIEESYSKWVESLFRVILIDSARTVGPHSDYSCVMTMGFDARDILWFLDIWVGRGESEVIIAKIMEQGIRWQAHLVAPESVGVQRRLYEECRTTIEDFSAATNWIPKVVPPVYPVNTEKGQRILLGLEWRFVRGRLKLPADITNFNGFYDPITINSFKILNQQIDDFTTDLALLPVDDAIDTMAMAAYIPRQSGVPKTLEPFMQTAGNMLARGDRYAPGTSLPLIDAVPTNELTQEMLEGIRRRYQREHLARRRPSLRSSRFDARRRFIRGL